MCCTPAVLYVLYVLSCTLRTTHHLTVLHCIALHCIGLDCTALHCLYTAFLFSFAIPTLYSPLLIPHCVHSTPNDGRWMALCITNTISSIFQLNLYLLPVSTHSSPYRTSRRDGWNRVIDQSHFTMRHKCTDFPIHNQQCLIPPPQLSLPLFYSQHTAEITKVAWNTQVAHILASASQNGATIVWDLRQKKAWWGIQTCFRLQFTAMW